MILALVLATSLTACLDGETTAPPATDDGSGSDVGSGSDDGVVINVGDVIQKIDLDRTPPVTTNCTNRRRGDGRCL